MHVHGRAGIILAMSMLYHFLMRKRVRIPLRCHVDSPSVPYISPAWIIFSSGYNRTIGWDSIGWDRVLLYRTGRREIFG